MTSSSPASPIVKICGIRDLPTLDFVMEAGADMVGFVHFAKSPRHAGLDDIETLIGAARGRAQSVVLLVNPGMEVIRKVHAMGPDFIQLHGSEPAEFVAEIVGGLGQPVLKALPVCDADDLEDISRYMKAGAAILLDAKPPRDASRPGGLGKSFDWAVLDVLDENIPYMLSGGLHPGNVGAAIKQTRPAGLDVSSGVESSPGRKDEGLVKDFIRHVRSAGHAARTR